MATLNKNGLELSRFMKIFSGSMGEYKKVISVRSNGWILQKDVYKKELNIQSRWRRYRKYKKDVSLNTIENFFNKLGFIQLLI